MGWASAQVVCICSINPQKVLESISKSNSMVMNNSTSLSPRAGERGLVIFSTKPKILVCDLRLPDDTYADCMNFTVILLTRQIFISFLGGKQIYMKKLFQATCLHLFAAKQSSIHINSKLDCKELEHQ